MPTFEAPKMGLISPYIFVCVSAEQKGWKKWRGIYMSQKSKHKSKSNRKVKHQKAETQHPLKSSWGAAVLSFLKEFFLNFGDSWYHLSYDEDLSEEGMRKKDLIWAPIFLITAIVFALLPFFRWEVIAEQSIPIRFFLSLGVEVAAIGMGTAGIVKMRHAIKNRTKNKGPQ